MGKLMILVALTIFLFGCGDIKVVKDDDVLISNDSKAFGFEKSYTIGKQQTVFIGNPIVKWREFTVITSLVPVVYTATTDFNLKGTYYKRNTFPSFAEINANKNDRFYYNGKTNYENIEYWVLSQNPKNNEYYLLIDAKGVLNNKLLIDSAMDRKLISENSKSTPEIILIAKSNKEKREVFYGLTREVIFGGVNNVTLNATYREYSPDDLARQAFYQNLVYQTSADTIRFRDFKIKVHEVTNEKITFTVLEDGLKE